MDAVSGVGVLDKASLLLEVMELGPASLAELVARTGLKRPTVHRLATALERLRLVARDRRGRFVLGPRLGDMAVEAGRDRLVAAAGPVLGRLRDRVGASARLYRRHGDLRVCVAAAECGAQLPPVPVGAALPMHAGAAAQVLVAWEAPELLFRSLRGARFTAATLTCVRQQGWAQTVGADDAERETASVAVPVRGPGNRVVAAVCVAGPVSRLGRRPGRQYGAAAIDAAVQLGAGLTA
ncbi:IclR family transcriptional regulator C-terminal domain-containing protein [Streptomyces fimicarius]|uniref:IclR family transcriptional regulator n=1 Tax=Streptomyces griseus TaxID=1911 RepID=UPI00332752B4